MRCLECRRFIRIKRDFSNLFLPVVQTVCNECLKAINMPIEPIVIPVENYLMYVYPLASDETKHEISYDFLFKDTVKKFLKTKGEKILLMYETLKKDDLELLDKLLLGNIWLLTTYIKEGENYEVWYYW